MYVIIKNDSKIVTQGIARTGWKYLDQCQEYAQEACTDVGDVVQVCSLHPLYTYSLGIEEEVNEVNCGTVNPPEEEEKPPCGTVTPPATDPEPEPEPTPGGDENLEDGGKENPDA